jgi:D-sedoheptulose 7-phosphate isomerase
LAALIMTPPDFTSAYVATLTAALHAHEWADVVRLADTLETCWKQDRQVFLCGNGGSAANAVHLANDFLYGIDKPRGRGLRVTALSANPAVLTCLANDVAYAEVYAQQLVALARRGDVLIALSGSGNSPNIVRAIETAGQLGVITFAILGYSGGRCRDLAEYPIHFPVNDMQVAEDLQMIVGHMVMQRLCGRRPASLP